MGFFQDYLMGQVLARNPEILKREYARQDQLAREQYINNLMGVAPTPARYEPATVEMVGPLMQGQQRPMMDINQQVEEAQPGSGVLGGQVSPQQLAMELMKAPTADLRKTGSSMLESQMRPREPGQMRTFEVGVEGDPRLKQRMHFDRSGQAQPVGAPYQAFAPQKQSDYLIKYNTLIEQGMSPADASVAAMRSQYLETDMGFVSPTSGSVVDKQVRQGKFAQKLGGSDADFYENYGNATTTLNNTAYDIQRTMSDLNELSDLTGYNTAGFGKWLNIIPMTDSKRWMTLRDTVTSNLALDKLMQLKSLSATGASGFGALSEKELRVLTDHLGNLEQANDPATIKWTIQKIYAALDKNLKNVGQALKRNESRYNRITGFYGTGTDGSPQRQKQERPDLPPLPPGYEPYYDNAAQTWKARKVR